MGLSPRALRPLLQPQKELKERLLLVPSLLQKCMLTRPVRQLRQQKEAKRSRGLLELTKLLLQAALERWTADWRRSWWSRALGIRQTRRLCQWREALWGQAQLALLEMTRDAGERAAGQAGDAGGVLLL